MRLLTITAYFRKKMDSRIILYQLSLGYAFARLRNPIFVRVLNPKGEELSSIEVT
jgi:hypothetical protein